MDNWTVKQRNFFADPDISYDGESGKEAAARARSVVDALPGASCTALVTHGNLMALLIREYDRQFGFEQWKGLTNPDVFKIFIGTKVDIQRTWQEE